WIERRYAEAGTDSAREKFEGYLRAVPCPACGGARLRAEILAFTVAGRSIADVTAMPISEAAQWLSSLTLGPRDEQVSARVRQEAGARLGFLIDVGLGYLSLD